MGYFFKIAEIFMGTSIFIFYLLTIIVIETFRVLITEKKRIINFNLVLFFIASIAFIEIFWLLNAQTNLSFNLHLFGIIVAPIYFIKKRIF